MYMNLGVKMKLISCCVIAVAFLTGCASGPSSYFRNKNFSEETHVKVAIVPLANFTAQRDADKKITYTLITYMLNSNYFDIIEMGEVNKAMKDARVRNIDDLSVDNIKRIGDMTGADVLLMGAIEEYKIDSSTMLGEKVFVPEVALSLRLVSTADGSIIWSANHNRRGDDRVTIFGLGRIDSISELTDIIVCDIVKVLVRVMRTKQKGAVSVMKNGNLSEEKEPGKDLAPKSKKNSSGKRLRGKAIVAEETPTKKVSAPQKPVDERKVIKDSFKKEFEKIKKQY